MAAAWQSVKGTRSQFPGTFRSSRNRWGMKVWIDGELHYLGTLPDRAAAADYVRLVESRYPQRLRRRRGTVYRQRGRRNWVALGPRPQRRRLGSFATRWAAERALAVDRSRS
jgi:hypothetical protein